MAEVLTSITISLALVVIGGCGEHVLVKRVQAHVDLGTIQNAREPVPVRVAIPNSSTKAWTLLRITPSCPCLHLLEHEERVEPGESFLVEAVFDPRGLGGAVEQNIAVLFEEAFLDVRVSGFVLEGPEFSPRVIVTSIGMRSGTMSLLFPGGDSKVELRSTPPGFSVTEKSRKVSSGRTRLEYEWTLADGVESVSGEMLALIQQGNTSLTAKLPILAGSGP